MNQGLLWTVIAILALLVVGMVAWNLRTPAADEFASPTTELESPLSPLAFPSPSPVAAIVVTSQEPGTSVTVERAALTTNGFISIHESNDKGAPGDVIGTSAFLPIGEHQNVSIALRRAGKKGETLHAMLHIDGDGNGIYLFPGPDVPAVDATGAIVMAPFTVGSTASPTPSPLTSASPKTSTLQSTSPSPSAATLTY